MLGEEYNDLFGGAQMANHVPRLGRRSLSAFLPKHRSGFRFFGSSASGGDDRRHGLAGFFGPIFNRYDNFRYYGGRPGEELARGLLRDKRMEEEYSDLMLPDNVKLDKDTTASSVVPGDTVESSNAVVVDDDQEYWKNVLGEATIKSVLEKMAQIGETREMIEEFDKYEKYGVGNPLPKYLARYNHKLPAAMTAKIKVASSYPAVAGQQTGILNKYQNYLPFPRRRKRTKGSPRQ